VDVLVKIPDEVTEIYRNNPLTTRQALMEELGISEHFARIFNWAVKSGKKVYHHELITKPESGQTRKAGLLPDIHFPYHDQRALDIAINYFLKVGIDTLIVMGDGVDCYAISFWRTDPTKPIFSVEVKQTIPLIQSLSDAFPGVEKVWLEGNHELRLRNELWGGSSKLAGLDDMTIPKIYKLDKAGFNYVSNIDLIQANMEPFGIAQTYLLHGHEIKIGWNTVNVARTFYLRNPMTQIITHFHRGDEYNHTKVNKKMDATWVMGCLCNMHPDYAPVNQWNHGLGVLEWDSDDYFSFSNKKIIDGRVL